MLSDTPVIVDGLLPGTAYRFRVAALNPVGTSTFTAEIPHKTDTLPSTELPAVKEKMQDENSGASEACVSMFWMVITILGAIHA